MVKKKSIVPSGETSEASDYEQLVSKCVQRNRADVTHQVDDTSGTPFLRFLLAEQEKTFASRSSPCDVVVSDLGLLTTEVACQALGLDSIRAEPEEFLLEDEAPEGSRIVSVGSFKRGELIGRG